MTRPKPVPREELEAYARKVHQEMVDACGGDLTQMAEPGGILFGKKSKAKAHSRGDRKDSQRRA